MIRPYATADLDALIALFRGAVRQIARRDYSLEQVLAWAPDEIDREAWALRLATSTTWVAAQGHQPTGFVSLEPDGHIDLLYVHADFQRRGIATALFGRLETSARVCGPPRLFTEASLTAKPFFERHGFHVTATQTVTRNGQELRSFRMARSVC